MNLKLFFVSLSKMTFCLSQKLLFNYERQMSMVSSWFLFLCFFELSVFTLLDGQACTGDRQWRWRRGKLLTCSRPALAPALLAPIPRMFYSTTQTWQLFPACFIQQPKPNNNPTNYLHYPYLTLAQFYLWCIKQPNMAITRSLRALRAPSSSWRPFGPFDFVLCALWAFGLCDSSRRVGQFWSF